MSNKQTGEVFSWKPDKGYGFIHADDGDEIFVHVNNVVSGGVPHPGQRVSFETGPSKKHNGRLEAKHVRFID